MSGENVPEILFVENVLERHGLENRVLAGAAIGIEHSALMGGVVCSPGVFRPQWFRA